MKTSKSIIALSVILIAFSVFATYKLFNRTHQSGLHPDIPNGYDQTDDIRTVINAAMANGNIVILKNYLADEVSMELLEEGDLYFKEEAIERLTKFFEAYPTQSYQEKHRGSSGSGAEQYMVGELVTSSGIFRTYLLTSDSRIVELNITED